MASFFPDTSLLPLLIQNHLLSCQLGTLGDCFGLINVDGTAFSTATTSIIQTLHIKKKIIFFPPPLTPGLFAEPPRGREAWAFVFCWGLFEQLCRQYTIQL